MDAKVKEYNSPSKAEQEYHAEDTTFDQLAQEELGHDIRKGDFPPIEPVWRPKSGN